jgi:hypothetical protein
LLIAAFLLSGQDLPQLKTTTFVSYREEVEPVKIEIPTSRDNG